MRISYLTSKQYHSNICHCQSAFRNVDNQFSVPPRANDNDYDIGYQATLNHLDANLMRQGKGVEISSGGSLIEIKNEYGFISADNLI